MKVDNDKHLEKFVDKLMKETSPESPSPEFTVKLMMQVRATEMDKLTVYKPLISKYAWFVILTGVIALTTFYFFNTEAQSVSWLSKLNTSAVGDTFLKGLSGFKVSAVTIYAFVLLAVMLLVQISVLNNYFSKRSRG